jgi:glucose/arabinose dehydrogenase
LRVRTALAAAGALALSGGCGGGDGDAEPVPAAPAQPALEKLGEFREPVFLAEQPGGDGTLYVVERAGRVRALMPDGAVRSKPVLDVSHRVDSEGEGGLFSIAFAPDGSHVFAAYSAADRLVVERYDWNGEGGEADARSRRELLAIQHPNPIHWGGLLTFGPDTELYLATGEGGPVFPIPSRAQNPRSLLGKLLRLDPGTGDPEVVAVGLRNPWRYSFDRRTGDLWIGDVGDFTEEEVDHVTARRMEGADFGWPAREGTAPTKSELRPESGAVEPVLTYSRSGREDDPRCAITGGYVVRDPALTSLNGRYLYADFCEAEIIAFPAGTRHPRRDREPTGLDVPRIASFAEDAEGRIYAISLEGPVYRIVDR